MPTSISRRQTLALATAAGAAALAATPAEAKTWTIAFVPKLIGIPYFKAMKEGLDQGAKDFGAKIIYQGPTTASVEGQAELVRSLINKRVDAVGVSANSPTALEALAADAVKKGIVFYSSDSQVDGPNVALRVQQTEPKELSDTVIDQLAEQIGKSGEVAFVSGGPTATNLNTWIGYMKSHMAKEYPDMKLVSVQYAGEDISKATTVTSQLLSAYPHLKGIVGVNSTAVPGAAQAVLTAGLSGKVMVTGITDPNTIRSYVKGGTVKSVVLWDPVKLAYLTVWGVVQILEKKPFSAENQVPKIGTVKYFADTKTLLLGPPLVITKANVDLNF